GLGPPVGPSRGPPVSDGASSGLAVNSERTWSGWQVIASRSSSIVPRSRKTSPSSRRARERKHVAQLAAGSEDELDLADAEAQRLEHARERERGRQAHARLVGGAGRRGR